MINDAYPYYPSKGNMQFVFQSEGEQGKVMKMIQFTRLKNGEWNLGFGDWKKGTVDDLTVTNNHDAIRVIKTVAKATLDFFETYPGSVLVIKGSDDRRRRLYNYIFQKHFEDITLSFTIIGIIDEIEDYYSPLKFYHFFKISLKFGL